MFNSRQAEAVSYAAVTVSIPPDILRRTGEVQWPTSVPGDPRQSFVTVSANVLDEQSFVSDLSAATRRNGRGKVLVFVHGFNNRFDQAVYRFAQITHDSAAPAVPVFILLAFAWRCRTARLPAGPAKRKRLSRRHRALARRNWAKFKCAGGHDPVPFDGCSPTLEALHAKALHAGRIGNKVKNVMLVAPDLDIDLFRTQMREMGSARPRFALLRVSGRPRPQIVRINLGWNNTARQSRSRSGALQDRLSTREHFGLRFDRHAWTRALASVSRGYLGHGHDRTTFRRRPAVTDVSSDSEATTQ